MTDAQIITPTVEILTQHKTPFLLNLLNNLRAKSNIPAAKSWKESKEKLAKEIIKLHEKHKEAVTTVAAPAVAEGAYDKKREAPKTKTPKQVKGKPAKVKSVKASKTDKPRVAEGDSELAKYIASKGFTPKTARARFRTHKVKKVEGRYILNAEVKKALE